MIIQTIAHLFRRHVATMTAIIERYVILEEETTQRVREDVDLASISPVTGEVLFNSLVLHEAMTYAALSWPCRMSDKARSA